MKALNDLIKLDFISIPESEERGPYMLAALAVVFFGLLLIGSVIFKFYDITSVYLGYRETVAKVNQKSVFVPPITEPTTMALSQYPLFGTAPVNVNEASSSYALIGVQFSEKHPNTGSVIIRANGSDDGVYRVGDTLPGGAIVNSITSNEVIILNNGVAQRLTLSWEAEGGQMTTTAQAGPTIPSRPDPARGMVPRSKFFQNFPVKPSLKEGT